MAKSGSPAPKPMTFLPAAASSLARLVTARVAEGAMAPSRVDTRGLFIELFTFLVCPRAVSLSFSVFNFSCDRCGWLFWRAFIFRATGILRGKFSCPSHV